MKHFNFRGHFVFYTYERFKKSHVSESQQFSYFKG